MYLLERAIHTRPGLRRATTIELFDEVYQEYAGREPGDQLLPDRHRPHASEQYETLLDAWYDVMGFDVATGMPKVSTFEAAGVPEIADRLVSEYGVQLPA